MELTLIVLLVVAAALVMISRLRDDVKYLGRNMDLLVREIISLKNEINNLRREPGTKPESGETPAYRPPEAIFPEPTPEPEAKPTPEPEQPIPVSPLPVIEPEQIAAYEQPEANREEILEDEEPVPVFTEPTYATKQPPQQKQPSWVERWMKRNPDLEKFIGENLINKIGIAVLVLGIAFFVKYAIDQNWINETGRVCIGLGCGILLVGLAHYLRSNYRSFSSVLAGGGIAVFYFTIAFAFHQYHLLSQTAAFIIMVVITAFAVALSVLYNKLELAIIATVGGFITPFLVSTGDGNYVVLFTYLIILNIGLLSLAWFKRWPALNVIALFFTEIIYGSWLTITLTDNKPVSYANALLFATSFYAIFMGMNMINQVRNRQHFRAFDFSILLLISCSYYAAGISLLHGWNNGAYEGLFTLGLGLVNLLLAWYIFKNGKADRNLLFLLIGLTFSFITLAIPIQLHGHAITLFWSAEFVLLYWLSLRSGMQLFKYASVLLIMFTGLSLLLDWGKAAQEAHSSLTLIFSNAEGIVTNIVAIAAFAAYYRLLMRNRDGRYTLDIPNRAAAVFMIMTATGLLYITCIFIVNLLCQHLPSYEVPNVYHLLITEVFCLTLLILLQRDVIKTLPAFQLAPLIFSFIFYIASSNLIEGLRDSVLAGHQSWSHWLVHWADTLLLGIIFYRTTGSVRRHNSLLEYGKAISIFITIMVVAYFSIEMMHIYVIAGHSKYNTYELTHLYNKAGLTAVWSVCSFAFMWLGMKHKQKLLRIISLSLFLLVLLKLFIFDISGISEGGKIFAFILLGVLLLTVSFMYQKLKKIIF